MRFLSQDLKIYQKRARLGCRNLRFDLGLSWLRRRLETALPARCWEETPAAFGARLRQCCANINAELNVDGLCRDLPRRIQQLVDLEGDRLKE